MNIKKLVDRFLAWPLPISFAPDGGISFKPLNPPNSWPIGTNLFTADEATQMLAHILADEAPGIPAVRAKMQCTSKDSQDYGGNVPQHKVSLGAIYGKDGENKDFADATPSGQCWMQISHGRPAFDFFKPGKSYYVTFTEAVD